MAEFALGLTKTAVEGTLSRVKSAIEEEGKQRVRVQEDLVFITGEFQMMQAFLNASSAGERASKNLVARAWVRQLRNLAFNVEDCVEFVVNLDKPSPWDWVQCLASSLPCLARPPLPLDEAVAEIKRLKARVEDVSQRNTRYNLMAGGADNDDQKQLLMGHTSAAGAENYIVLTEIWKAMGKLPNNTGDLKMLINCHGSDLKVITLWGSPEDDVPGELGWASIVKKAYDDPEICQEFKNRAWVKVPHPFYPVEFLNNLLTQFTSHHCRHDDMSKLLAQVSQHKYLVVLEKELSSIADWDAIKVCLPDDNNGSRIIISTKHLEIARVCTGEPFHVWEFKGFTQDRYLCALFPKGCGHRASIMGEFMWQLGRHRGVISLFWRINDGIHQLHNEVMYDGGATHLNVFNKVKFEHQYRYQERFMLSDFARHLLSEFYKVVEQRDANEELTNGKMSETDLFERCRKFLTEHNWLIYLDGNGLSLAGWDLIRRHLLCESTRGCIVVITTDPSVAKHCVDYQQQRVLNIDDLRDKDSDGVGNQQVKEGGLFVGHEDKMIFINPDAGVNLFAVWGIAGVGKSALAREKYNKSSESYIKQGWADVPNPFNLMSLCRRLLLDFFSADVDGKETAAIAMMEGQDPIQECCKILCQNKCFLVIDGLQSTHDWDLIKAALSSQARNDSLTFVITREESIARHCTISEKHIYNLNGLLPDKALDLFKKITLDGKELCEFPHEAAVTSELIVSKCGGIPQVIVAIGKAVRTNHMKIGHFESVNTRFMDILVDASSNSSSLRGLFCWMQSYFKACSDELKPCIFYLSVFSAGKSIRWKRLIRRWMAEGYLSGCGATAEEKGDKLVLDLWKLSMLYIDPQTSRFNLKANGFFREYIKSQPLEDYLVFELEGSCSPSSRLAGQHLTISRSWDRDEVVFKSIDMSRLRSLTVFGKWMPFLISDKMKVLRVLDLEGTSSTLESDGIGVVTDDDQEMIGKQFPRLKFMSLRGCKHITCLPDSLGAMKQLETLNIRHTSIVELPPAVITKLNKLQYIRAGTTNARPLQAAAAAEIMPTPSPLLTTTTTTTEDDVHCGMSPLLEAKAEASCVLQRASTRITGAWKRRANALVESSSSSSWWESKKQRRCRVRVAANGGGVEVVPAAVEGIGKLTLLHRLSVVSIAGGKGGLLLLKELKKLTQLRKLGLSGINPKNWEDLTLAISGHFPHLESLPLQLQLLEKDGNYEFACFDDISLEPKTLKRLKVFYNSTGGGAGAGAACIRPAWIEQFPNLERFNHEVRVSSAADMDSIGSRWLHDESYVVNEHRVPRVEQRLGIKPIDQHLSTGEKRLALDSLVIYCSGIISKVTCGPLSVKAVRIHCCSSCGGSLCLRIDGLERIHYLNEVFVTGPCSAGFKEELQKQLDKHEGKPALRLL